MTKTRQAVWMILAVATLGCRPVTAVSASDLAGIWVRVQPPSPPLRVVFLTLSVDGSNVTGDGLWQDDATTSGSIAVVGVVTGDSVRLELTYAYGQKLGGAFAGHAKFRGRLMSSSELWGMLTADGAIAVPSYYKKPDWNPRATLRPIDNPL